MGKLLTKENEVYYEKLMLNMRVKTGFMSSQEQGEEMLLIILEDILEAQAEGVTAEVYFDKLALSFIVVLGSISLLFRQMGQGIYREGSKWDHLKLFLILFGGLSPPFFSDCLLEWRTVGTLLLSVLLYACLTYWENRRGKVQL